MPGIILKIDFKHRKIRIFKKFNPKMAKKKQQEGEKILIS
jgi:hypothetical protein